MKTEIIMFKFQTVKQYKNKIDGQTIVIQIIYRQSPCKQLNNFFFYKNICLNNVSFMVFPFY